MPYTVKAFGASHRGLIRQNNEDAWLELPSMRFFALADGMGGHLAGEIASKEAISVVCRVIQSREQLQVEGLREGCAELRLAMELANEHVFHLGLRHPKWKGMGTTLCCVHFLDCGVIYGHVGDSRIYRLRGGFFEQLSRDDSLLMDLVDQGQLSESEAAVFVHKNIITKAIGMGSSLEPSIYSSEVFEEDLYLMCSDGLSDLLNKEVIAAYLGSMSIQESAHRLIQAAIDRGGHDNITVVIMKVVPYES